MASALNLPKFRYCTSTVFAGLASKDANTLYFLTDTKQIFKGETLYSGGVEFVSSVPAVNTLKTGIIYVNTSNNCAYLNNNGALVRIGVPVATTISDDSTANDADAASISAIKSYVSGHKTDVLNSAAADSAALNTKIDNASSALNTKIDNVSGALTTAIDNTSSSLHAEVTAVEAMITGIGVAVNYKGVKANMAALNAITGMKPGDVWTVQTGETVDGVVQQNVEYIYCAADETAGTAAHWEMIGGTVDLSGYAKDSDVEAASSALHAEVTAASAALHTEIDTASGALNTKIDNASAAIVNTNIANASSALHAEITSGDAALDSKIDTVSGALNTTIGNTSSALHTEVTNASSALHAEVTAVDAAKLDKFTGTNGNIVVVDQSGNAVKDGTYSVGGTALASSAQGVGGANLVATEEAVAAALAELNWQQLS